METKEDQEIGVEEFMQSATDEQKQLLFKIADLAEREHKLATEINEIHDSIKIGGMFDGFAITPIEDEDDALIVSIRPRQELDETRNEMKRAMIDAVRLGMANVGIIHRNYESYVGTPI